MIDSVPMLLDILRRVQLFALDQVDEVERELAPAYEDPAALGEYLVQIEWLTSYQFQVLFDGRWDELNIGSYTVLDRLGEGGVSEVFKAWDTHKGRIVALKVLRQNLATLSEAVQQFQRELEVVTRLNHQNIIKTFDAHQLGTLHYFAMEYVEGMDLHKFVEVSGPLPVEQACEFVRQVSQGLQHAHQLGLVHRDVKPANLFLLNPPLQGKRLEKPNGLPAKRGADPVVKILDWGLARLLRSPEETLTEEVAESASLEGEKGKLVGTADYIAPEQAVDASIVDTRADIYSLGCVFFYLLTGRAPFTGTSLMRKLMQHQKEPPPPIQQLRPDVPDELAALIDKMLAKAPEDRFQIPLLVAGALRKFAVPHGSGGSIVRPPGLSPNGTALRPGSSMNIGRPGSSMSIGRPASSTEIPRPGGSGPHPRR